MWSKEVMSGWHSRDRAQPLVMVSCCWGGAQRVWLTTHLFPSFSLCDVTRAFCCYCYSRRDLLIVLMAIDILMGEARYQHHMSCLSYVVTFAVFAVCIWAVMVMCLWEERFFLVPSSSVTSSASLLMLQWHIIGKEWIAPPL